MKFVLSLILAIGIGIALGQLAHAECVPLSKAIEGIEEARAEGHDIVYKKEDGFFYAVSIKVGLIAEFDENECVISHRWMNPHIVAMTAWKKPLDEVLGSE